MAMNNLKAVNNKVYTQFIVKFPQLNFQTDND